MAKTALVTGVSRGIGLELAVRLNLEGYKVYGTTRSRITSPQTLNIVKNIHLIDGKHLQCMMTYF